LLADDHQAILDCVTDRLAGGFEIVATVLDGQAALDATFELKPDAVVLDISMPRMTGVEVARRLSESPNPPRIVFLTVNEVPDFLVMVEAVGASGDVPKGNRHT